MKPRVSLRQALADPNLLGNVLAGDSWRAWRTVLIAAMGEVLTDDERVLFRELTGGREREPGVRIEELIGVVGRRGGKSRAMATSAVYLTGLVDYTDVLAPGERGILLCIAPDQRQASITRDYAEAAFEQSPILRQLITNRTQDTLELGAVSVDVRAASARRLRGPSYIGVIADEGAFFSVEDSTNPDTEILNAVRPGLATTGGPLFLISSPYARKGELWTGYKKHFGPQGDPRILVVQGASRAFNPSLPQSVIDRAYERDPVASAAEFGAQFRTDIEAFVSLEAVEACVTKGVFERPRQFATGYAGFVDMSGGSQDSAVLAVGHLEARKEIVVVDLIREICAPHSPEAATAEFARELRSYGLFEAYSDRYAASWAVEQFARYGINLRQEAEAKSVLYQALLASINSRRVDLLDNPRVVAQCVSLERRTGRTRDVIDHPPGAHDDVANAVAGLVATILSRGTYNISALADTAPNEEDPYGVEHWRRMRNSAYIMSGGAVRLW